MGQLAAIDELLDEPVHIFREVTVVASEFGDIDITYQRFDVVCFSNQQFLKNVVFVKIMIQFLRICTNTGAVTGQSDVLLRYLRIIPGTSASSHKKDV